MDPRFVKSTRASGPGIEDRSGIVGLGSPRSITSSAESDGALGAMNTVSGANAGGASSTKTTIAVI
jgi:hypothetical protein